MPRPTLAVLIVLAVASVFALGGLTGASLTATAQDEARPVTARGALLPDERTIVDVFERVAPSVVFIDTVTDVPRRDFFGRTFLERAEGSGSGFVWDERGHIVTNHHVIDGVRAATVTLASGDTYDAELVGFASDEDLAVLKIDAPVSALVPVPVGRSSDLRVGQRVLAIGNPFGLDQTLTVGHLSALGRTITSRSGHTIYDVLQTDAAINPGNSGGPLLDSAGRLVGVNTAIRSASRSSAGIGFAVPVDRVNTVVPQIITGRMGERPRLGFVAVERPLALRLGVQRGVLIASVYDGTGADEAGLRATTIDRDRRVRLGDVIVTIDNQRVDDLPDLQRLLRSYRAGDEVDVEVLRDGERVTVRVELDPPPRRDGR